MDKVAETVGGQVGEAVRGVGDSAAGSVGKAVGDEAKKALGGLFRRGEAEERAPGPRPATAADWSDPA